MSGASFAQDVESRMLSELFEQAPAFVALLRGPTHVYTLTNELYRQVVGRDDLVGKPIREALPELAGQGIYELLDQVFTTGEPFVGTEVPVTLEKNGTMEPFFFTFIYQATRDTSGSVTGVAVFGFDATSSVVARRQAEKLAEERAFAFEVLDRGEPFVCLDADYTITFFNQAWADLAKRAPSELQGKNFWKVFPEVANEESAHWKSFHKCLETQEPVRAEVYYEPLDIHSQLSVFPTKNGGIAIFVRDINEEKRVERAKAELDRALQHTLEAEQAARRVADEANRTKDEFLATVSHELRTPLTAILGWTTILRAGDLEPAKVGKALETIERNARSQSQLIEDLLDLSRIVSGKLRLAVAPVDVHAVVEAAIDVMMPAAEAKGIRLTRVLDPHAMPIAGDAERLQQVVWNLIANAIKFTPRGGRVQVRLSKVDSQILIAVSDNGQGMTPDFIAHAFERFRQADGATTRSHGGLGLGLSIVKSLVELHGGTVEAVSEGLGKGSELRVKIPISPVMRLAVETPEPATVAPVFSLLLRSLSIVEAAAMVSPFVSSMI